MIGFRGAQVEAERQSPSFIRRVFCQRRSMRSGSEIMISIAARAAAALAGLMDALEHQCPALWRRKSMVAASDAM